MERSWIRVVAFGCVLAAVYFAVSNRWWSGGSLDDETSASGGHSKVQGITRTERSDPEKGVSDEIPVDTAELRKEALEILGRLDERPNVLDIVEDAARLSEIFRQWGRVDFEEARRFLETEEAAKKMVTQGSTFADRLFLAALIGYSRTDPVHAWNVFLTTQNKQERLTGLISGDDVGAHEVPAEAIMRALFTKSEKEALKLLRELSPEHSHLITPSLRAIMSESDDAGLREELFKEFYKSERVDMYRVGLVCAGLAEHDPQMAWEFLSKATKGVISEFDPELFLRMDFIRSWSHRQPAEALRFIAEFKQEELQDESQTLLLMSFIYAQYSYHPELIVEALEMDSLKRFQEEFFSGEIEAFINPEISWPLIDENVPLSSEIQLERFKHAVESSEFPDSLKENLLKSIELELVK